MKSSRIRAHLCVLATYLALAVVMTYPLVLQMSYALPDIGEDGWFDLSGY